MGSFLKVVAKNFDVLAGPVISLVYPLYASVKAIETKSREDDQQWLTYWVLYSLITLFELTFAKVIEVLPFWSYAKLVLNCWLVLPYFSGAAYVYQHYVRPLFANTQTVNIWYIPRKKDIFSRPDDVLIAAEKFIEENGPEALEKLMNRAERSSKFRSGHSTMLDEASKFRSGHSTVIDEASKFRSGHSTVIDEASKFRSGHSSILDEASKFTSSHSTILDDVHAERESNSRNNFYSIFGDDYRY